MKDEKEILKDLLVDDESITKDLANLVQRAKNVFQIHKETGKILFKNFGNLTNQARICALLIGKKFAKKLDIPIGDSLTVTEIGKELGIPATTLSSPIADLMKKGYIIKNDKKYEIAYNRLPEVFDEYLSEKNAK